MSTKMRIINMQKKPPTLILSDYLTRLLILKQKLCRLIKKSLFLLILLKQLFSIIKRLIYIVKLSHVFSSKESNLEKLSFVKLFPYVIFQGCYLLLTVGLLSICFLFPLRPFKIRLRDVQKIFRQQIFFNL